MKIDILSEVKKQLQEALSLQSSNDTLGKALHALGDDHKAVLKLGKCYYEGVGVIKNFSDALRCFRLSAEHGNGEARFMLGICFENGFGVEKDLTKAQFWFEESASKGYEPAKCALRERYNNMHCVSSEYAFDDVPQGEPKDFCDLVERCKKATLELICGKSKRETNSSGTGFIIDGGLVVTNHHVVYDKDSKQMNDYIVAVANDKEYELELISSHQYEDIAILKFKGAKPSKATLKLGSSSSLKLAQQVFTIGNPMGRGLAYSSGSISNPQENFTNDKHQVDTIRTDMTLYHGNSGGPLFDRSGTVIGMITFLPVHKNKTVMGWSFAVSSNAIKKQLGNIL
jgi:S1-C subfamily serine protease